MLALPILAIGGRDAAFVFGLVERNCFYERVFLFAPGLRAAATRFIRFSLGSAWRRLGYEDA